MGNIFDNPFHTKKQSLDTKPTANPAFEENPTIVALLVQFCKSTSIKGIPKIYNSEEKYVKALWALAVTFFLAIALFQTHSLLYKYLQYNTVLRSQRFYYSENEAMQSHWFPTLTVCDLQYTWLDMHTDLLAYMRELNMPSDPTLIAQYESAWKSYFNGSSRFDSDDMYPKSLVNMESMGRRSVYLKSMSVDKFAPYCRLLVSGLFKRDIDCTGYVTISLLPVFDYQTCIRIDLNMVAANNLLRDKGYSVYGIQLLLFASRQTGDSQASGGIVFHHNPFTQANVFLDRSSLTVSPGRQYAIQHEEVLIERKNTTQRNCAVPQTRYRDISGRMVNYTTVR